MRKFITFFNRTVKQLNEAYFKLKKRYQLVIVQSKLVNGWYVGWFEVEGNGVRYLKYT